MAVHQGVLLKEVIELFNPQPNNNFIDGTLGAGGHALAILVAIEPDGKLLGIDLSKNAIDEISKIKNKNEKIKSRLILVNDNFVNLKKIVEKNKFFPVKGILFDLGLSTDLLEESGKGFSFQKDEFLDMRFGDQGTTAYEIINQFPKEILEKIFKDYGEEKHSDLIAKEIVRFRHYQKIKRTSDLTEVIRLAVKEKVPEKFMVKVWARIFQAIRIIVNDELEILKKVLSDALEILEKDGKIGVISFHSLEDRIVKSFFKDKKQAGLLKIITKKPVIAKFEEIKNNPRSRSAKLRMAQKI